jgi:phosphoglycerate dehydrogenase-like enzyme
MFDEPARSEVVVANARGVLDRPIAEFVLGSILAFAKEPHRSHELQTHRIEHRETLTIAGGNVLVVGTGAIGREIARLLRGYRVLLSRPESERESRSRCLSKSPDLAKFGRLAGFESATT